MSSQSDRREQLALLRQSDADPVPQAARIRIERLLERLELVLRQIKEVEAVARDWEPSPSSIGQPGDIAPIAVFLASPDSRWLTGEILLASGGLR